jgi:hypothetical protein
MELWTALSSAGDAELMAPKTATAGLTWLTVTQLMPAMASASLAGGRTG